LKELSISAAELARQIDLPVNRVTGIINGQRAITADTALRLGHWFGTSPEFWLNLQKLYELRLAREGVGDRVERLPKLTERKHEPRNWTRMTTQGQRRIHHPLRARWFFRRRLIHCDGFLSGVYRRERWRAGGAATEAATKERLGSSLGQLGRTRIAARMTCKPK
jgi:addiction module HigA family antidote